jgi:hypothetical protein
MTSMISKYKHVRISWYDICSNDEAWTHEDEILNHDVALCEDTGYIYKKTKSKLWLFTSYSEDENGLSVGGLTCFPMGCIKKIKVLK